MNRISARQLANQFGYEHPGFPRCDWEAAKEHLETTFEYWDWVVEQLVKEQS